MAKSYYSVLEASESASQATLETLFNAKQGRLKQEFDGGNVAAKDQLWALSQAYAVLSNPDKRAAYDQSLYKQVTTPIRQRPVAREPIRLSWKLNVLLIAAIASGLVGFGLQLGRSNKKDEIAVQVLEVQKKSEVDATRAGTERLVGEGMVQNTNRAIETQGQVANRMVGVQESTEARAARELEYRANAGAEMLRQQQERLRMQEEQMKWQRQQAERASSIRQTQDRVSSDRMEAIQLAISSGRLVEARSYARTSAELALVSDAERRNCLARTATRRQRESC